MNEIKVSGINHTLWNTVLSDLSESRIRHVGMLQSKMLCIAASALRCHLKRFDCSVSLVLYQALEFTRMLTKHSWQIITGDIKVEENRLVALKVWKPTQLVSLSEHSEGGTHTHTHSPAAASHFLSSQSFL